MIFGLCIPFFILKRTLNPRPLNLQGCVGFLEPKQLSADQARHGEALDDIP